jgi:hypothetical protein
VPAISTSKETVMRMRLSAAMSLAVLSLAEAAPAQTAADLKARCNRLLAFYEWYGAGRKENSDGARNHAYIGAYIDCQRGHYVEGIAAMESLLRRKRFDPSGPLSMPGQ